MGSSVGATIFYCVALSMVIVMTQLPPTEADSVASSSTCMTPAKKINTDQLITNSAHIAFPFGAHIDHAHSCGHAFQRQSSRPPT